ncbi:SDR family oxidoreductase [Parahaliea maris]|uniref:SDR family oxidoreductase n=1 Tax=Parahaliea maris TaxID=2716870 RepID=A0A5C8ZWL6_9GAMM|nr:SDR family oxidoreductase [Parahaliea maris]TXS91857.1 SDR family oxidoreductase [Parahaliea maris]
MSLQDRRVLITGSTMGIGRAAAEALLKAGAKVAIHGRKLERVEEAAASLGFPDRTFVVAGDVGDPDSCRALVDSATELLGGLDYLVCNAGIGDLSYPEDITEEHWDKVMDVNCRSGYLLTKFALPALRESRGAVLLVASAAGVCAGPSDNFAYAVAKAGMMSLAQSLAVELAPAGIRINALCPGFIDTPLIAEENAATGGQVHRFVEEATLLGRIGTEEECASTIEYLATDAAAYFTGVPIVNDGGLTVQRSWGGRN